MFLLRGGVSPLFRLLPLSNSSRLGAEAAGMSARVRLCVITLSLSLRWLLVAACLPLYALAERAEAVRAVSGVWRCCILES